MHIRSRSLLKFTTAALILLGSFAAQAEPSYNASGPVLIRPFGDSITYGFGYQGPADATHPERGWACPVFGTQTPNLNFQFPANCQWPLAYGGGYRGWMTLYALQTGQFTFSTEGYQNSGSYWQQWLSASHSHDGYPGARTDQLMAAANLASTAEVTLLHAGTNDIAQCILGQATCPQPANARTPDQVATATFNSLVTLVTTLLAKNENTNIFVAQIIPFAAPASSNANLNLTVTKYNALIGSSLISKLPAASQSRVKIVNMGAILDPGVDYDQWDFFNNKWIRDGIHPGALGYWKMACVWVAAIQNRQNVCPVGTQAEILKQIEDQIKQMGPPPMSFQQWMEQMQNGGAPPGQ